MQATERVSLSFVFANQVVFPCKYVGYCTIQKVVEQWDMETKRKHMAAPNAIHLQGLLFIKRIDWISLRQ